MLRGLWQLVGTLTEEFRRQSQVAELERLTDEQLDDLGLRRDQLATLGLPPRRPRRGAPLPPEPDLQPGLICCG